MSLDRLFGQSRSFFHSLCQSNLSVFAFATPVRQKATIERKVARLGVPSRSLGQSKNIQLFRNSGNASSTMLKRVIVSGPVFCQRGTPGRKQQAKFGITTDIIFLARASGSVFGLRHL